MSPGFPRESTRIDQSHPFRLMLVEDEPREAKTLLALLEGVRHALNFRVSHVVNLEEACELQSHLPQDVILLDLSLPDSPGSEAIERLRRTSPGLPVIALAASAQTITPAQAFQHGAFDLLVKAGLEAYDLVRSVRYAAERRRMKEALRSRKDKLTQYQGVLLELARLDTADLQASLRRIMEATARSLGVERVSLWLFDESHAEIVCKVLYRLSLNAFEKGHRLRATDYPRYFRTLEETRVIAADDAGTDPRTSEFTDGYLKPLGISSMMDVPVRSHGRMVGVLCHEHTGPTKEWPLEDQEFASSVADLVALHLETSERRRAEEALREERNFVAAVLDSATTMVVVLDPQGRIVRLNRAAELTLGYSHDEVYGRPFARLFFRPEDASQLAEILARTSPDLAASHHEHTWLVKDESARRIAWTKTVLPDDLGKIRHYVLTAVDITERKALEDQLIHDAFHDALTGLANRALFMDRLTQCLRHLERRKDLLFAVLFVDLDRFKLVNDSLGPSSGDRLLCEVAQRLEACVRPGDTVARLGGDEFALLLEDVRDSADAAGVSQRVLDQLRLPLRLDNQDLFVTASIGIALSETGYLKPEQMMRDADIAMYRAKGRGGGRHEVFDKAMHARAVALLRMETDLRRAIERHEFEVHYQPVVSLRDGRIAGFEALVRWRHPDRGLIPPLEFIQMAEETGLVIPLDRWVLRESCRQLKDWRERFSRTRPLTVSVNLSGKQFTQPDLVEHIRRTLQETGLEGECLGLELTESVLMDCSKTTSDMLLGIREGGPRLFLDDFGTGYSSLGYLHRFPIDSLKVDRSFVAGIGPNGEGSAIVRTIVALAQNLDIHVVAEGVETPAQVIALKQLQCEFAQGFAFSKPVNAWEAEGLLSADARW